VSREWVPKYTVEVMAVPREYRPRQSWRDPWNRPRGGRPGFLKVELVSIEPLTEDSPSTQGAIEEDSTMQETPGEASEEAKDTLRDS